MRRLLARPSAVAIGGGGSSWRAAGCRQRHLHQHGSTTTTTTSTSKRTSSSNPYLRISPRVAHALGARAPVVALESTIITHGMPYPDNLRTAQEVEAVVRAHGATPATIAILDGTLCVGLEASELEALAKVGTKAAKCSRRDIPTALAARRTGSTTVASTMAIAHMAGVRVFVTGGIGGVHRGAEATMDVSADLIELGRIPHMAVVCAGVKSILDIPKTLEVLETQGVPVLGYGTDTFPAFFTPDSGQPAPARADSPEEVARVLEAARACGLPSSVLVAVPNPRPAAAGRVQAAVEAAVAEAEAKGLRGQAVTPFILQRVSEATGGESLRANIELIKHNAAVGAQVAVALAAARTPTPSTTRPNRTPPPHPKGARGYSTSASRRHSAAPPSTPTDPPLPPPPRVLVVGGAVMDVIAGPQRGFKLETGTSTPGAVREKEGGVGRNVAEGLARLGVPTAFVSAVGEDPAGTALLASLSALGPCLDLRGVRRLAGERTAACVALLEERGDLHAAVADMAIFAHALTPQVLQALPLLNPNPNPTGGGVGGGPNGPDSTDRGGLRLAVADGNLSPEALAALAQACANARVPLLFEPTSTAKAALPVKAQVLGKIAILKPNLKELAQLAWVLLGRHAHGVRPEEEEGQLERLFEEAEAEAGDGILDAGAVVGLVRPAVELVLRAMRGGGGAGGGEMEWVGGWDGQKHVLVTLGVHGLVWGRGPERGGDGEVEIEATFFPARPVAHMADCTGAGDTLVAAVVGALVAEGCDMEAAIKLGMAAARRSVKVLEAIPRDLTFAALARDVERGRGEEVRR